jgi:midasin (ATPase involved in ribosome maturation)
MAKVEITESLYHEMEKKFKREALKIIDLMHTLEQSPHKGKLLGTVGGIAIKELKYGSFRFYFVADGFRLTCMKEVELTDLLIQFVRMSDKKHQQETINEIKQILLLIGPRGFG